MSLHGALAIKTSWISYNQFKLMNKPIYVIHRKITNMSNFIKQVLEFRDHYVFWQWMYRWKDRVYAYTEVCLIVTSP